jgi:hypothetical protein
MIELTVIGFLALTNLALIAERFLHDKSASKERQSVLNALMARTPQEFANLEVTNNPVEDKTEPVVEDLTPMENITDEKFEELINQ